MNREGNVYTFLYASVMVIIVAGILASVSLGLKSKQKENIEKEKMQNILKSVNIITSRKEAKKDFQKYIADSFVINSLGEKIEGKSAFHINMANEMKKPVKERFLPIYIFKDGGEEKIIIPVYGNGMWGPIWGFISFNNDKITIYGATFDHKSETPGLGAEISTKEFQQPFTGKKIFDDSGRFSSVKVVKGGAKPDDKHAVDAITGGTVTSNKLEKTLTDCLIAYEKYMKL